MYAHVNMDICTYAYISVVHSRQWKIEWYTRTTHLYIGSGNVLRVREVVIQRKMAMSLTIKMLKSAHLGSQVIKMMRVTGRTLLQGGRNNRNESQSQFRLLKKNPWLMLQRKRFSFT